MIFLSPHITHWGYSHTPLCLVLIVPGMTLRVSMLGELSIPDSGYPSHSSVTTMGTACSCPSVSGSVVSAWNLAVLCTFAGQCFTLSANSLNSRHVSFFKPLFLNVCSYLPKASPAVVLVGTHQPEPCLKCCHTHPAPCRHPGGVCVLELLCTYRQLATCVCHLWIAAIYSRTCKFCNVSFPNRSSHVCAHKGTASQPSGF